MQVPMMRTDAFDLVLCVPSQEHLGALSDIEMYLRVSMAQPRDSSL